MLTTMIDRVLGMHHTIRQSSDLPRVEWVRSCTAVLVALLFVLSGVQNAFADQVTSTIPSGSATDVTTNPITNLVYVTHHGSGTVDVVNGSTGAVVASIPGGEVYGIAVNPATNRVYTVYSCSLAVIDGSSSTVINTFSVSCPLPSHDVAVNQVTGAIYVSARYSIEVFDGSTNARIASISPGCNTPYKLDLNSATAKVYVTCVNNNLLSVVDGATNSLVQTIPLDASPQDVAANLANNETYVATLSGVTVVA